MTRTVEPFGERLGVGPALGSTVLAVVLGGLAALRGQELSAPPTQEVVAPEVVQAPPINAPVAPPPVVESIQAIRSRCGPVLDFRFRAGSAAMTGVPGVDLGRFTEFLERHPEGRVVVDGHADASGSPGRNLALSHARATAVASWLTAHGVAATRMTARGFGAYQPLPGHEGEADRNRRVRVSVTEIEGCDREEER